MKNAYDQTIQNFRDEMQQVLRYFTRYKDEDIFDSLDDINMIMIIGEPWALQQKLMPLLDKYINNINKVIFSAFKEGMSRTEKEELTEIRGEEPEVRTRGRFLQGGLIRELEGQNPDYWKEQLRGE